VEAPPTYVFFRLASPDDAHGLVSRLEPICRAWTELQPEGEWIVGVDVAHGDHLSRAVRAAAGWAAEAGLNGLPLEYDDEIFFVPAAPSAAVGAATGQRRSPRSRKRGRPMPALPLARDRYATAGCRPARPVARRRPWR
jgi:hypothetical protein